MKKWFQIIMTSSVPEILMYGYIGEWREIDFKNFQLEFRKLEASHTKARLRINSGGGVVMEGMPIYDLIRNSKMEVEVVIEGIAASMASVVALAGDKIMMTENSRYMIHRPRGGVQGEVETIESYAETLKSIEDQIALLYMDRTSQDQETVKSWMQPGKDKWIGAEEAVELGLADGIIKSEKTRKLKKLPTSEREAWGQFAACLKLENKYSEMKELAVKLGLAEEATEQEIIEAIEKLQANQKKEEDATSSGKSKVVVLGADKPAITAILEIFRENGVVNEKNEEKWNKILSTDFETGISLLKEQKADGGKGGSLAELIKEIKKDSGSSSKENEMSWEDYQEKDPEALIKLKNESPEKFRELFKAHYGYDYTGQ